jgi:prepilin-type N-terminal cleavage/methylation domain-containing protein
MLQQLRKRHDQRNHARERGFTLLELLVVFAIIVIMASIGFPALRNLILNGRLTGAVDTMSIQLAKARQQAIAQSVPVVAIVDTETEELLVFANLDRDPGLTFTPGSSPQNDRKISHYQLPAEFGIHFRGPGGQPGGEGSFEGLTLTATGDYGVVFLPDGSVDVGGAIRVADERGNVLEIRIGPAATGKTAVLKYHPNPPWGGSPGFFPRGRHPGTNDPLWQWS